MAIRIPVTQDSPAWLEARRSTIGSSDIPIIVGESPHKDAHTLAAEKLGLVEAVVDAETQELFDIGHLMQPVLLDIYERKTGRHPKAVHGWRVHRDIAWATASLDGTAPTRRVVEAKWTNAVRWRPRELGDERLPGDVAAQVQWQLFVTGWDVADVVVMRHGIPDVIEVGRDDAMIEDVLWFARDFHGYLERGELPPPTGSDAARRTLAVMHPLDDGTWLPATADLAEMVRQLAEARAAKSEAEKTEKTVGNALRAVIGDATGVDGLVSLKKSADSVRTNWPAVASAFREALERVATEQELSDAFGTTSLDDVVSIHSETAQGPRVLRLLKGGTE